jgi:hypothetical protein
MLAIAKPDDAVLTRENWQAAVYKAVATLPEDIRNRTSVEKKNDQEIVIQLEIVCPSQDQEETILALADPGHLFDTPVEPDPHARRTVKPFFSVQLDEDKITVDGFESLWVGGETETTDLEKEVHLAILRCFVGCVAAAQDNFGRFYRVDGSRILLWQWGE